MAVPAAAGLAAAPPAAPPAPSAATVALSVVAYSLCSGTLLLANKVVLVAIPAAPLVTAVQCAFVLAAVLGCSAACGAPSLGVVTRGALQAYALYGALFVVAIYCNMKALEHANVDTLIVFRAATPLLVAAGDWAFMGRAAPSARSLAAMGVVVLGCGAFVAVDAAFVVAGARAYAWVGAYVAVLAVEMLLGKAITAAHDGVSLAGSVVLTNAVALGPFLAIGAATGELARGLDPSLYTPHAVGVLALSCALSAGIGFSSWWARSLVSATTFTVVGVANKVVTVLLNIVLWDKHASPLGTAFLLACLAGGAAYQQAPMRAGGYAKLAPDADGTTSSSGASSSSSSSSGGSGGSSGGSGGSGGGLQGSSSSGIPALAQHSRVVRRAACDDGGQ